MNALIRGVAGVLVACGVVVSASSAMACGFFIPCAPTAELSNFAHAQGLGFRNAGLFGAGGVYVWNTKTNAISEEIAEVPLSVSSTSPVPTTLSGSNIRGISVSADFGGTPASSIALDIGKKITFSAENATRTHYSQIFSAMADEYAHEGPGKEVQWHIDELKKSGSGLLYLIVSDVVNATKATVSSGGQTGDNPFGLTVTLPGTSLTIKVNNAQTLTCQGGDGKAGPCFFEVLVAKPFINSAGNLDFASDINYKQDDLIRAMAGAF